MSDVIGIWAQDDALEAVVIRRRLRATRVLGAFRVDADETAGASLRAHLRELGVRSRWVHVGIPRRRAIVKAIELPPVPSGDLRRMVGFELERHLPFPPAEAVYDFDVLDARPEQPTRVLLVATERRTLERLQQLVREAGLEPRLADVAVHAIARLGAAPGTGARDRVVARIDGPWAELAVVARGRLCASRAAPLPADAEGRARALALELTRTLASLPAEERQALTEVALVGEAVPVLDWDELPVRAGFRLPPGIPAAADASLEALALAVARPLHGRFPVNLVPEELRPRPFPWPVAVPAGLAALALLLAAARPAVTMIAERRALARLDDAVGALAPDVRRVESLAAAVDRARREVEALRGFEAQGVHALPVLRELTELLPEDVWLTTVSADRNGLELAGFAGSASQLIPLLEGSPRLERVEFTSPVTKGRDREQFRLKAGWERPGPGR